jgi:hypothetical protein
MRNNLLLLFTFFAFSAFGQITLVDPDVTMELSPDEIEVHVDIPIVNEFSSDVMFWWEIERGNSPAEWEYKVCDINLCYLWGFESCPCSQPNDFAAGDTATMIYYINPNGVEGTAVVNLRIIDECRKNAGGGSGSYLDIPITITVDASVSAVEEELADDILIYPNPTPDLFKVKNDNNVSEVILYNIVGKKIFSHSHKPGKSHDISYLNKGIYLVRLLDKNNNIVKVLRLTKE